MRRRNGRSRNPLSLRGHPNRFLQCRASGVVITATGLAVTWQDAVAVTVMVILLAASITGTIIGIVFMRRNMDMKGPWK